MQNLHGLLWGSWPQCWKPMSWGAACIRAVTDIETFVTWLQPLNENKETDFFFFFNQWGHKGFSLARRATQRQMTGKQKAGDKTCWHRRWQSFWQDWRYTTASGRATGLISGAGRLELNRATAVVYTLRERMHDGRMRPFGLMEPLLSPLARTLC